MTFQTVCEIITKRLIVHDLPPRCQARLRI